MILKPYFLCAIVMLIKSTFAQYVVNAVNTGLSANSPSLANNGLVGVGITGAAGLNGISNGGGFQVTSSSPIAPTGLTVFAENLRIEGPLAVEGSLPLLGTVALEGHVPTAGMAGVSYGCGNGKVGIESLAGGAGFAGAGLAGGLAYGVGQTGGLSYSPLAVGQTGLNGQAGLSRVY